MVFKQIKESFREVGDTLKQVVLYKNKSKSHQCSIMLLTDNRLIIEHPGLLSEDRSMVLAPILKRTFYNPVIYINEKGEKVIYVSERTHGDYPKMFELIKNVAKAQKYKVWHKWQHYDRWITTKTYLAEATIDFNMFDNKWSVPLSSQTNSVIQAKNLSFLFEMADTKKILLALASAFFGVIIGIVLF